MDTTAIAELPPRLGLMLPMLLAAENAPTPSSEDSAPLVGLSGRRGRRLYRKISWDDPSLFRSRIPRAHRVIRHFDLLCTDSNQCYGQFLACVIYAWRANAPRPAANRETP